MSFTEINDQRTLQSMLATLFAHYSNAVL